MSRVLLAGASGETGRVVLAKLLEDERVKKVTALVRRPLQQGEHEKLNQVTVNYDELDSEIFNDHDVGICCLGTTRGKSGAKGFYKVDHDYVMAVAENCKNAGCSQFHLLSSTGANANSWFLYPQTKGIVDDKVLNMGFQRAVIYRPALIMVEREEQRTGEAVARWVAGWADKGNSMSAKVEDIAAIMAKNQFNDDTRTILGNADIVKEGAKLNAEVQVVAAPEPVATDPEGSAEPEVAEATEPAPVAQVVPEVVQEAEVVPETPAEATAEVAPASNSETA